MNDETTIASIDFLVSLDTSTTPYVLTVTGNNKVGKSNNKQPLTWKLDGALKHGEFVGMDDCRPGFEWLNWPPPDPAIFDKAQPQGKDKLASRKWLLDTYAECLDAARGARRYAKSIS